jgi:hypothetical protein
MFTGVSLIRPLILDGIDEWNSGEGKQAMMDWKRAIALSFLSQRFLG